MPKAKAVNFVITDDQERKLKYQMGLGTPVVYAVNHEC